MAFAYIDAKHTEVLAPPTASEYMQSVMQRHQQPVQIRLEKVDRQTSAEITNELGC